MANLRNRVADAVAFADLIARKHLVGNSSIPFEDLEIIRKYEALGLLKILTKRVGLQESIYWPIIQARELNTFSYSFYLRLVHAVCNRYGIKTGLGLNSVREYVNKPYQYGFIEPVIVPDQYLGKEFVAEELEVLKELLEQTDTTEPS